MYKMLIIITKKIEKEFRAVLAETDKIYDKELNDKKKTITTEKVHV